MDELKSRIATLAMTTYGLSLNAFEKKCGLPETTLNKMKEGSELRTRNLARIIKHCPEIDFYYLITGEFKEDNPLYSEYAYKNSVDARKKAEISVPISHENNSSADAERVREMELKLAKTEGERDTLRTLVEYLTQELGKRGAINQSASL